MVPRRSGVGHAFLDHPGPLAFAHRGGAAEAPENSLRAFTRAYDLGFRWFETDVRSTADGQLVVFHDASLRRVADVDARMDDVDLTTLDEVTSNGEPIMRFVDLVSSFPDVRFNVDPKDDHAARLLARALLEHQLLDRVCVASFSDARLGWIRVALGPQALAALSPGEVLRLVGAARLGQTIVFRGRRVVQVPEGPRWLPLVGRAFVRTAHRCGLQVHVWTVNDPARMNHLLDLGVDGIMTDYPAILRDVLRVRGQWFGPEQHVDPVTP
ncbi:MAG: glycerophosphodiester phosphodiesterase family protein [Actinomycetes bacterium]